MIGLLKNSTATELTAEESIYADLLRYLFLLLASSTVLLYKLKLLEKRQKIFEVDQLKLFTFPYLVY